MRLKSLDKPDKPGWWVYNSRLGSFGLVKVEHNVSSGIFCRKLKMGGSIHCGFNDWDRSLQWLQHS